MRAKGFTLVEILIVVVILGILAAIVVPQFTDASADAKLSSLRTDLQTMRSQIQLYRVQHAGATAGDLPLSTSSIVFDACLTAGTTLEGAAGSTYGPYLQLIPTNPFTTTNANSVQCGTGTPGSGDYGWYFNTTTGNFFADTDAHIGY